MSGTVLGVGATCFGIAIGYIAYRSVARSGPVSSVSDIAAVLGSVGGGVVTSLFDRPHSDDFGWYAIGLLVGMVLYVAVMVSPLQRKAADSSEESVFLGSDPRPNG